MKLSALVVALVLSSSADQLASTRVKSLNLKVPAAWKASTEGGTSRFAAPNGDAEFALDVFEVDGRGMDAKECTAKLMKAVGGDKAKWSEATVGGAPAAVMGTLDASETKKDEFQTRTYVGCNGHTKWGLTFSMKAAKADRYAQLANDVVQTISYTTAGTVAPAGSSAPASTPAPAPAPKKKGAK